MADSSMSNGETSIDDDDDEESQSVDDGIECESRDQKIAYVQEITALSVDECRNLLDQHDWDVETSVGSHFGITTSSSTLTSNREHHRQLSERYVANDSNDDDIEQDDIDQEDDHLAVPYESNNIAVRAVFSVARYLQSVMTVLADNVPLVGRLQSILNISMRFAAWHFQGMMGLISSVFFTNDVEREETMTTSGNATDDVLISIGVMAEQYGITMPQLYHGSYQQLAREAVRDVQYVLAYIHDENDPECDAIFRNVICNNEVINFLNEKFLMFVCLRRLSNDYFRSAAPDVPRDLSLPLRHRCSILFPSEGRLHQICHFSTLRDGPTFIIQLTQVLASTNDLRALEMGRRNRLRESSELRRNQDLMYQRSLDADREKERKRVEQDATEERERHEKLKMEQEMERQRKACEDHIDDIPQPLAGEANSIFLAIKLPNGSSMRRRFIKDNSLQVLHYFICAQREAPYNYNLYTKLPKRLIMQSRNGVLNDLDLAQNSLVDSGLGSSQALIIEDCDA